MHLHHLQLFEHILMQHTYNEKGGIGFIRCPDESVLLGSSWFLINICLCAAAFGRQRSEPRCSTNAASSQIYVSQQ